MTCWMLTESISVALSHTWASMFDLNAAEQSAQAKAAPDWLWSISMVSLRERAGRFDSNPARQAAPFTCNVIALKDVCSTGQGIQHFRISNCGNHETSLDKASGQIQKLALLGKESQVPLTQVKTSGPLETCLASPLRNAHLQEGSLTNHTQLQDQNLINFHGICAQMDMLHSVRLQNWTLQRWATCDAVLTEPSNKSFQQFERFGA